jgi:hypothetical protein
MEGTGSGGRIYSPMVKDVETGGGKPANACNLEE